MGKMQRDKGKVWEREVAAAFRTLFGSGVKRGWQAREGHDAPDVDGTPFWLEAKHHAVVNIAAAVRQALADRKKAKEERWIIAVTKSNRAVPLATMPWTEFMMLLREWVEAKAEWEAVVKRLKATKPDRGELEKEIADLRAQLAAERENCAKAAEQWADGQDREAMLKEQDAPASASAHADSAIIGRRIAQVIRTGYASSGAPGAGQPVHPPVQAKPEPVGAA
jgi:hypothetical protein